MYKKGRVNSNSRIISSDEDPSLRIESSAIINLRGVFTKLNKYIVFTMQTYKKLITEFLLQGIGTGTTQWEHQLTLSAVWKHRMVQGARWKDGAFH